MKRTPMKRRTPLRQRRREGADIEREEKPRATAAVATLQPLRRGVYSGGTTAPAPKTSAYRDPVLLEMARGRPCLLLVPAVCTHRVDQTVACHSNLSIHGKGERRKADDCYSVWGCAACHRWLDQPVGHSGPSYEQKREAFIQGLQRQQAAWRQILTMIDEPERFRRAARRALELLHTHPG